MLLKLRSILLCFVVGVHTIAYAYPNVKIVTAAVDPEVNDKFHIIPGIGKFFGTIYMDRDVHLSLRLVKMYNDVSKAS